MDNIPKRIRLLCFEINIVTDFIKLNYYLNILAGSCNKQLKTFKCSGVASYFSVVLCHYFNVYVVLVLEWKCG